jgi:hypothetical protein
MRNSWHENPVSTKPGEDSDQSQAGQKRGGGSEPPPRAEPGSAKEGLDGQNRDKRNGEGLGRI